MVSKVILSVICVLLVGCSSRLFYRYSNLPEFAPEQVAQHFYEVLNNRHLVMVGDSLMRYQYVSLVHLLHYGTFPEMLLDHANLLWEAKFPSYMDFFQAVTAALAPNEFCDCHREVNVKSMAPIYEDRYYRDEKRIISVTYIVYFGDKNDIHGHFRPNGATGELVEEEWRFSEIYTFLEHIHELVSPPPAILLLNAGFHANNFNDAEHRDKVAKAAKLAAPRVIWKTANCPQLRLMKWPVFPYDMPMCAYEGIECMNLEWTCYLTDDDLVDALHFQPPIYGDINVHLLEQLRHPDKTLRYKPIALAANSIVTATDMDPAATFLVDEHGRLRPVNEPSTATVATIAVPAGGKPCVRTTSTWEHHNRTARELLHHIIGDPWGFAYLPCEGTLVRKDNARSIYLVQGGKLREFQSWDAFVRMGYDLDQVKVVKAAELVNLPFGEPIY